MFVICNYTLADYVATTGATNLIMLLSSGRQTKRKFLSSSSSSKHVTPRFFVLGACLVAFTLIVVHYQYDDERSAANSTSSDSRNGEEENAVTRSLKSFSGENFRNHRKTVKAEQRNREKTWGKLMTRPDDWETWSFHEIRSSFDCRAHAHDENKPLPDMDFWNHMRETYKQVVNSQAVFDDPVPPTEGYTLNENNGEKQPYYAKHSPGKGRGLFASRDIMKGEVVHDGSKSDVEMSGEEFRRFLFALPRKMACDASEWAFTQQREKDGPYTVRLALSIPSLMNESDTYPNAMPESSYSSQFYALRDIKKDEEILYDYLIYPTRYKKVGM